MYISKSMSSIGTRKFFPETVEVTARLKPRTCDSSGICKLFLRVVKLTAITLLIGFLQLSARTTAQLRISISLKSASLEKVFAEIEKRSGYTVFYNTDVLKTTSLVTVDMKDATIEDVLRQCLKGLPLVFTMQDKTIFIKKETRKPVVELAMGPGSPVPSTLSGVVRTETGAPLMGATVYVLKLKKTLTTDKDGIFTLKDVPDGEYEVLISFVGYENYKTKVSVKNHEAWLNADLKQSMSKLDETVVKGYYNTTNRLNTGDVTTVSGEDINKQPVSDPILALEGRVPGLYISQTSGMPGASYTVLLRGLNSIANGTNPLYIVDGVPYPALSLSNIYTGGGAVGNSGGQLTSSAGLSPFNNLNPADIESIEVLKDADATAIYGSRGANGVVLITTKKGKSGQNRVDVNVFSGEGKATRMYTMLNTQQYLALRHQAFYNDSIANPAANITPGPSDYDINGVWDSTRYTDWQKVLIGGTAHFTNAQASISGGNANTQFVLSGGYSRQGTVFPGDYYDEKASVHANISHASVNQRFHALFSAQYVIDNNILPSGDFTNSINLAPDAPPIYDAYGHINFQNGTWNNPIASTLMTAEAKTDNLLGNLNLSYEIFPGLQLKGSFGYTHIQSNQSNQTPAAAFYGPADPDNRVNLFGTSDVNTWIVEPQITYAKRIAQGKLDVLIGSTVQRNQQDAIGQYATGFLDDALIPNIAAAGTITINGSNYTDYRYNALFGRLGYVWQEKYILNVTARRDGSSRFGPGNQWGNFGAVGVAWVFSKEKLIQDHLPFLSFGKLRASYGTTGNDQIGDYQYLSTYTSYTNSTYQGITGLYPTQLSNPNFRWELVRKMEAGIELGWLHDRIMLTANYYRNRTSDQLVGYPLPSMDGFTSVQGNLPATVQNSGAEIGLNTINVRTKDFTWNSSINVSIPRNKLVSFPGLANTGYVNTYDVGKSLFIQHLYHYTGVDPQTGLYTFQDVNKDGVINNLDRQFLKEKTQSYFGGFLNSFSYKGLQLDVMIQFVKQTGANYLSAFSFPGLFNNNLPNYILDRWQKSEDLVPVEKPTQGAGSALTEWVNMRSSDYTISNASFVRLKNVSLSYTLPGKWKSKAHFQNARVYLQCQNLFTITQYKGLDPETQGQSLPPLRMITAGLQVTL